MVARRQFTVRGEERPRFHDATRHVKLRNSAMPGPLDTQTQSHGVLAMVIRPHKPRNSAQSALLDCSA